MSSVARSPLTWVRVESGIRKRTNGHGSTVYEVRVRRKGATERTLACPTLRDARTQRDMSRSHAWGANTSRTPKAGARRLLSCAPHFAGPQWRPNRPLPLPHPRGAPPVVVCAYWGGPSGVGYPAEPHHIRRGAPQKRYPDDLSPVPCLALWPSPGPCGPNGNGCPATLSGR